MTVDALVSKIRALPRRPALIAVEGQGGSGKSTLAQRLAAALDGVVVTGDDFYRVMPEPERAALTPEEGYRRYFDDDRLRDEAIVPLKAGHPARYRRYNWEQGGGLGAWVDVPASPFVIVERTYVTRPELRGLYDFIVYVDTPTPMRMARLDARGWNGDSAWPARWEAAEVWFQQQERPQAYADAIVRGDSA
ncbi:uridine kinase [Deinococcus sp. KSM4-11]|uniref:uridine kinase family protein n=1 Tax=Deinococcus sp. KSM4-11 TaxID=2568654 RepID=UPI001454DDA1|nr:zeta toxin family protein [Deinococcus sp. KSM4-11]